MSLTVTLAVQTEVFPPASVARKVTLFKPMLAQVNVLRVSDNVKVQLSVLPLFTAEGATVTVPLASRLAVMFLHLATGGVTSFKVTVKEQAAVFPLPSLAVKVTRADVLCPTSAVLGAGVWVTVIEPDAVQLSLNEAGFQVPTVAEQFTPAVLI